MPQSQWRNHPTNYQATILKPNQSINQSFNLSMEHVPKIGGCPYNNKKAAIYTYNIHLILCHVVNYLKLSSHLLGGLPFGLFPSKSPVNTAFVVLSLFISCSLVSHFSCLLFTRSKMPSWPSVSLVTSFLTLSTLFTPSILLNTLIYVACTLDCSFFDKLQASHPYISVNIMVAFTTFSLVFLLSSFLLRTTSLIPPLILVAFAILASTSFPILPSWKPKLVIRCQAFQQTVHECMLRAFHGGLSNKHQVARFVSKHS